MITFNNNNVKAVMFNGQPCKTVYFNGVEVFSLGSYLYDSGDFTSEYQHSFSWVLNSTYSVETDHILMSCPSTRRSKGEVFVDWSNVALNAGDIISLAVYNGASNNIYTAIYLTNGSLVSPYDNSVVQLVAESLDKDSSATRTLTVTTSGTYRVFTGFTTNNASWSGIRDNLKINSVRIDRA